MIILGYCPSLTANLVFEQCNNTLHLLLLTFGPVVVEQTIEPGDTCRGMSG